MLLKLLHCNRHLRSIISLNLEQLLPQIIGEKKCFLYNENDASFFFNSTPNGAAGHETIVILLWLFLIKKKDALHLINISIDDKSKHTILHKAVLLGRHRLVEMLLDLGVDTTTMDAIGNTPLLLSKSKRIFDLISRQLMKGNLFDTNQLGKTLLIHAIQLDHFEKAFEILSTTEYHSSFELLNSKLHDTSGSCTALDFAIEKQQLILVEKLLLAGSCPSISSSIILAVRTLNISIVSLLLKHHCCHCAKQSLLSVTDGLGLAPLHIAVLLKSISMLRYLIQNKAPLDSISLHTQQTALMMASASNQRFACQLLIQAGAHH